MEILIFDMPYLAIRRKTCERAVNRQPGDRAGTCKGVGITASAMHSESSRRPICAKNQKNLYQKAPNPRVLIRFLGFGMFLHRMLTIFEDFLDHFLDDS